MRKGGILLFIICLMIIPNAIAQITIYGIYSNVDAFEGEPSGFEMYFLNDGRPGNCDTTVIFQVFEGWPQYPEVLDCCDFSADNVEFVSEKWGKFSGKVKGDTLSGEFVDIQYKISLIKGNGFWQ